MHSPCANLGSPRLLSKWASLLPVLEPHGSVLFQFPLLALRTRLALEGTGAGPEQMTVCQDRDLNLCQV
jgi:hypothetical protein